MDFRKMGTDCARNFFSPGSASLIYDSLSFNSLDRSFFVMCLREEPYNFLIFSLGYVIFIFIKWTSCLVILFRIAR